MAKRRAGQIFFIFTILKVGWLTLSYLSYFTNSHSCPAYVHRPLTTLVGNYCNYWFSVLPLSCILWWQWYKKRNHKSCMGLVIRPHTAFTALRALLPACRLSSQVTLPAAGYNGSLGCGVAQLVVLLLAVRQTWVRLSRLGTPGRFFPLSGPAMRKWRGTSENGDGWMCFMNVIEWMYCKCTEKFKKLKQKEWRHATKPL